MMATNKRAKGRGSVYPEGNRWIGALPPKLRPPRYVTGATEEEATMRLDAALDGKIILHIPVLKHIGEDGTAIASENETTLPRVLEPEVTSIIQKYIADNGEQGS